MSSEPESVEAHGSSSYQLANQASADGVEHTGDCSSGLWMMAWGVLNGGKGIHGICLGEDVSWVLSVLLNVPFVCGVVLLAGSTT